MKQYVPQQLRIISSIDVLIGEYILALLNSLKSCSISFKLGEYFGKNSNW